MNFYLVIDKYEREFPRLIFVECSLLLDTDFVLEKLKKAEILYEGIDLNYYSEIRL